MGSFAVVIGVEMLGIAALVLFLLFYRIPYTVILSPHSVFGSPNSLLHLLDGLQMKASDEVNYTLTLRMARNLFVQLIFCNFCLWLIINFGPWTWGKTLEQINSFVFQLTEWTPPANQSKVNHELQTTPTRIPHSQQARRRRQRRRNESNQIFIVFDPINFYHSPGVAGEWPANWASTAVGVGVGAWVW